MTNIAHTEIFNLAVIFNIFILYIPNIPVHLKTKNSNIYLMKYQQIYMCFKRIIALE